MDSLPVSILCEISIKNKKQNKNAFKINVWRERRKERIHFRYLIHSRCPAWPWQVLPHSCGVSPSLQSLDNSFVQISLLSLATRHFSEGQGRALQAGSEGITWSLGLQNKPFLSPALVEFTMMFTPQISLKNKMFHMPPGELVDSTLLWRQLLANLFF